MKGQEDVANTMREAFAKDPKIRADRIRILMLAPDTVALTGEVQTLAEKDEAGFLARQIAPQYVVDNALTVAGNRLPSDAELTACAQSELAQEGFPSSVGVVVRGGVAILRGTALSLERVRHASLVVARVPGIREVVTDHLPVARDQVVETIGPERGARRGDVVQRGPGAEITADIDGADIVNRIEQKLGSRMQPPRSDEIRVSLVGRGSVRLTGFVKSAEERARAELLARSVSGVTHVRNLLVSQDGSAGCNEAVAALIRHALAPRRDHASPADIKVFVLEDTVYLQGDVDFPEQAMEAEAIARRTPGIQHVHSELRVTERHPRPGIGEGHAVEAANRLLKAQGLDGEPTPDETI